MLGRCNECGHWCDETHHYVWDAQTQTYEELRLMHYPVPQAMSEGASA